MKIIRLTIVFRTLLLIWFVLSCRPGLMAQNDTVEANNKTADSMEFIRAKQFISQIRSNKDYYVGEGTASIGNDIGKANVLAKKRALEDLSSRIRVRVQSTIIKVVTNTSQNNDDSYSENTDRKIQDRTNFYTNQVLTDVEISQSFYNYPDSGYITVIANLNKNSYKKRINEDLNAKKMLVRTRIQNGDRKYAQGYYIQAIKDWTQANNYLNQFFNGLPLQDNLGPGRSSQNVAQYINGKITFFFSGLRLVNMTDQSIYDSRGRLNAPVFVAAKYKDENGIEHPVTGLPLKAGFITGEGTILPGIKTGSYGQAKLLVSYINPAYKSCLINITVDTAGFKLDQFKNIIIPSLNQSARKMRTIAFSVTFNNNGQLLSPEELKNKVQSTILESESAIEQVSVSHANINQADIQQINQGHADYFLRVYVHTLNSSTVGGYQNMYVASCSATVSLYELPLAKLKSAQQIPTVQGYGTTASGAGWDALNKMINNILSTTQTVLGEIK